MLAKKLTPERVTVNIEEGKLTVVIRDEAGQHEYDLSTQLYGAIVVADSRWELLSTKVDHPGTRPYACKYTTRSDVRSAAFCLSALAVIAHSPVISMYFLLQPPTTHSAMTLTRVHLMVSFFRAYM